LLFAVAFAVPMLWLLPCDFCGANAFAANLAVAFYLSSFAEGGGSAVAFAGVSAVDFAGVSAVVLAVAPIRCSFRSCSHRKRESTIAARYRLRFFKR
jgi:hypothetical protein